MVFGVFAAALAGKQFSGHEVSFIVGLGATGTIAALLYFAIAFGKITITTLNAYGSVMSIATVVSGFRGDQKLSARSRLAYILGMVGIAMWLALARASRVPEGILVVHPVPAGVFHAVERDQSGRLLLHHTRRATTCPHSTIRTAATDAGT